MHKKIFKDRLEDITKAFEVVVSKKEEYLKDYVTIEEVGDVLAGCGAKVSKEQLDHMHLLLFKENDSLDKLPWRKLCDFFGRNSRNATKELDDEFLDDYDKLEGEY
jgi:hypothetical protein